MDLSAVNINLNALTGSNITIIIGIFVTLAVMGITTFYDKRKDEVNLWLNPVNLSRLLI